MDIPTIVINAQENGNGKTLEELFKLVGVENNVLFLDGTNGTRHAAYHPEVTLWYRRYQNDRFWNLGHIFGKGGTKETTRSDLLQKYLNPFEVLKSLAGTDGLYDFINSPSNVLLAIGPIGHPRTFVQINAAPQPG